MSLVLIGYLSSVLIGISLGLIGGGGSILTVPILVYLFSIDSVAATAYSLFIVGTTSALGSVNYFRKGLVNLRTAIVFGVPSIIAVFLTRAYVVPAIPTEILHSGTFILTKGMLLMLLFAVLMIVASYNMINTTISIDLEEKDKKTKINYPFILLQGTIEGALTGLVGAGGGFLIIPALVLFSKLDMKEAVGTSLVIIAAKSLIGFLGDGHSHHIDWQLMFTVITFASVGLFIGILLSRHIDGCKLKPAFGWFTLFMGFFILIKEILL